MSIFTIYKALRHFYASTVCEYNRRGSSELLEAKPHDAHNSWSITWITIMFQNLPLFGRPKRKVLPLGQPSSTIEWPSSSSGLEKSKRARQIRSQGAQLRNNKRIRSASNRVGELRAGSRWTEHRESCRKRSWQRTAWQLQWSLPRYKNELIMKLVISEA